MGAKNVKPDIPGIRENYALLQGYYNGARFSDPKVLQITRGNVITDDSPCLNRMAWLWQSLVDVAIFCSVFLDVAVQIFLADTAQTLTKLEAECHKNCTFAELRVFQAKLLSAIYAFVFVLDFFLSVVTWVRSKLLVQSDVVLHGVLDDGARRNYRRASYEYFLLIRKIRRRLSIYGRFGIFVNDNVKKGFITFVVATGKLVVLILANTIADRQKERPALKFLWPFCMLIFSIRLGLFLLALIAYPICWLKLLKEREHGVKSGMDLGTILLHAVSDTLNTMFGRKDSADSTFNKSGTMDISSIPTANNSQRRLTEIGEDNEIVDDLAAMSNTVAHPGPAVKIQSFISRDMDFLSKTSKRLEIFITWDQITIPRFFKPTRPFAYVMYIYNWIRSVMHIYATIADLTIIVGLYKSAFDPVYTKISASSKDNFSAIIVAIAFTSCCLMDGMIYFMCWFKSYPKIKGKRISETFVNPIARTYFLLRSWRNFVFMFELRRSLNWTAWFGLLAYNFLYHTLWVFIILPLELFTLYIAYIRWELIENSMSESIYGSYWNFLYFKIATASIRLLLLSISCLGYYSIRKSATAQLGKSTLDVSFNLEKYLQACAELNIMDTLHSQDRHNMNVSTIAGPPQVGSQAGQVSEPASPSDLHPQPSD